MAWQAAWFGVAWPGKFDMDEPILVLAPGLGSGAVIISGAGVVLAWFYCMRVLRKYVGIIVDVMDNQAWVPENGNGDSGSWMGDEVCFPASDGHRLCGVLMRGRSQEQNKWEERGVVIFAHEFASDRSIASRYCRPLVEQGFDVLAFDFRGHGSSPVEGGYRPRQWPSDRETADMRGAIHFARKYLHAQDRPDRIALFGLSRGACTAILAAEPPICAIVADGAYSSDWATEYFMRRFAGIFAKPRFVAESHPPAFWRFLRIMLFREYRHRSGCDFPSVRRRLQTMGRMPILFIHGEKDSYIPVSHCQSLYDLADGPKALWIVPHARHNQCMKVDPAGYSRRVIRFLDEHLSLQAQPRSAPARARRVEPVAASNAALVPNLVSNSCEPTATAV